LRPLRRFAAIFRCDVTPDLRRWRRPAGNAAGRDILEFGVDDLERVAQAVADAVAVFDQRIDCAVGAGERPVTQGHQPLEVVDAVFETLGVIALRRRRLEDRVDVAEGVFAGGFQVRHPVDLILRHSGFCLAQLELRLHLLAAAEPAVRHQRRVQAVAARLPQAVGGTLDKDRSIGSAGAYACTNSVSNSTYASRSSELETGANVSKILETIAATWSFRGMVLLHLYKRH